MKTDSSCSGALRALKGWVTVANRRHKLQSLFFAMLVLCVAEGFAETKPTAPVEGETKEKPRDPKADWKAYKELEQTIYAIQKPGQTKIDTKTLQTVEARVEKLLKGIMKDVSTTDAKTKADEVLDYQKKSMGEIIALAENYREASQKGKFENKTIAYRVETMCQSFADSYKALAKGDLSGAKTNMKRALEKRDEIRGELINAK
jgi:hypothetical protein